MLNILNMVYTLRFFSSSKCNLFHNSNVFDSCIIHILYMYSTNIGTENFKHGIYSPFFSSSKCNLFNNCNMLSSCIINSLYTGCAKIKKIIPAPKGQRTTVCWRSNTEEGRPFCCLHLITQLSVRNGTHNKN